MENFFKRKYLMAMLVICGSIFIDQYTKYLAVENLKDQAPYPLWPGVFQLEYLENTGAAFGLFKGQQLFFCISLILVVFIAVIMYGRIPSNKRFFPLQLCVLMIISGGIGNFIDRVKYKYVVDFLYFKLINFPIFNVADIYVTLSVVVIFLLVFFFYKEEELEAVFRRKK